jgi:hypothetical protein
MMNLFFRFSLWGAALMVLIVAMGLGYRYLFVTPNLIFPLRILTMMTVGSVAMGVGVGLLRTR